MSGRAVLVSIKESAKRLDLVESRRPNTALGESAQPVPPQSGLFRHFPEACWMRLQLIYQRFDFGVDVSHAQSIRHLSRSGQAPMLNKLGCNTPSILRMNRKKRPARTVLAENLSFLQGRRPDGSAEISNRAIASKKGLSPGVVDYMAKGMGPNPTLPKIEAVADYFGLEVWQLLTPGLPKFLREIDGVQNLFVKYSEADDAGRELITKVAERAAPYGTKTDNKGN